MIVCSCNVLNDGAIRRGIADAGDCAARMSDVFDCLGCRPQCGRCAPTIKKLIRESVADDGGSCPAMVEDTPAPARPSAPFLLAAE